MNESRGLYSVELMKYGVIFKGKILWKRWNETVAKFAIPQNKEGPYWTVLDERE